MKDVGQFLDSACSQHKFDDLIFVMDGKLSGFLKENLGKSTREALLATHDKDLAWLEGQGLKSRLESLLKYN